MKPSARPVPNPAAVCRQGQDGWAVLVNLDTAGSLALNAAGIVVWQLVDGRRSVGEIVAAVRSHYCNAPATVTDDVTSLLDELAEEGFLGHEWTSPT